MSAFSDYLEDALLNHTLRNVALTAPATVHLALFNADPTDANATAGEVTGGSYSRQTITFGAPASGSVSNDAAVSFADMPADTVSHWGIYDAATAGNLLFHGQFSAAKTTAAGDTLTVAAGNLTITLD